MLCCGGPPPGPYITVALHSPSLLLWSCVVWIEQSCIWNLERERGREKEKFPLVVVAVERERSRQSQSPRGRQGGREREMETACRDGILLARLGLPFILPHRKEIIDKKNEHFNHFLGDIHFCQMITWIQVVFFLIILFYIIDQDPFYAAVTASAPRAACLPLFVGHSCQQSRN